MVTPYSQLTLQQKQKIIEVFQNGMECRAIPSFLGVSERAVARVLSESGVNTKRRNRYTLEEDYFDSIDSNTKAYLLGLIAADGCVTATNYIVFESTEIELAELLKQELHYTGKIRIVQPKGDYTPHYRINFSSKKMVLTLAQCGIFAGRSFSDRYYFPAAEYIPAYILGYFDGDGCAYVNKGRSGGLVCIVGSFAFTDELSRQLKMGVVVKHQRSNVYYWRIYSRQNIQTFYQLIYQFAPLGLVRKKQKIEQILRSYRRG
jgi:hypothetical protein